MSSQESPRGTSANSTTLRTFQHVLNKGWNSPLPVDLNSPDTFVFVAGASKYADQQLAFRDVRQAFPDSVVVGCSTAGEILGTELFDDSLCLAVMRFVRTGVSMAAAPVPEAKFSREAGRSLGEQLTRPGLRGILVLSDGLNVNGSELVSGLADVVGNQVVVTGGLAGDGANFKRTWVLRNFLPVDHTVTAVGFYGNHVRIGHGSRGGWDAFGPRRTITRSSGNVLYELDGSPALELYKKYLGERAAELPSSALLFPLRLEGPGGDGTQLVRTVLSVDEANQSMTFAGDVPTGVQAQLMRANFNRLVDAAGHSSAAATAVTRPSSAPALTIAISCVGRRLVLGERTEEELEAAAESLREGDQQIGFYSYGELSPFGVGRCELHNQTMTTTSICEA
jgi:hypothetical protein